MKHFLLLVWLLAVSPGLFAAQPNLLLTGAQLATWMRQQSDEEQPAERKALTRMPKSTQEGDSEPKKKKARGTKRGE